MNKNQKIATVVVMVVVAGMGIRMWDGYELEGSDGYGIGVVFVVGLWGGAMLVLANWRK